MVTPIRALVTLTILAMLLPFTGTAYGVELATGLLYAREDDHVYCCVANTDNVPITFKDVLLYTTGGFVSSAAAKSSKFPAAIPRTHGGCVAWVGVPPEYYRCLFDLPDATAERIRTTLMIADEDNTVLGELEGHPLPALGPCASAAPPQCNGSCPEGSNCLYSEAFNDCYCGVR